MADRRRGCLAAVAAGVVLLSGCAGGGTTTTGPTPEATEAAPLLPEESELPSALPSSVVPSDTVPADVIPTAGPADLSDAAADLADAAEALAEETYGQKRPKRIDVAPGATTWQVGRTYRGSFADPEIVEHNGTWFAYGTNTAGLRLPTLTSKNLVDWRPLDRGGRKYDPLRRVGNWVTMGKVGRGLWAPSVAEVGDGWTVAYSAKAVTLRNDRHNCIGLARGSSPRGPFQPVGRPICSPNADLGLIDPDIHIDGNGTPWLLWKFSGVKNKRPAGLFVRQLNAQGTDFAPGAETRELLRKQYDWEGRTIENPSMIEFRGVTYLFYSANSWKTKDYATGYAICSGPQGPCVRPKNGHRFLSSARTGNLGPGGATAFVRNNSLHLLYHAWDPGMVLERRRLHVAGLWQRDDGTLRLVHPG